MRAIMMIAAVATLAACGDKTSKEPTQREQIGQVWKYEGGEGGKPKVAYIGSANSVQTMTAPDTFSVLLVQPLKEGGADVTVKLVGAPFTCDLSDCRITATTDDGKRHEWQGRMATNDDGIAIAPSQGAYDVIRKAKSVKVDLVVDGKAQTAPFDFNVAGLDLKG
ncbi:hypothetical protein [Sphingomonas bisphenolicum]|uniref:Uncharacterized protein n=1 Tax=Sphingomonas bisphenolicum TaxID=296544 RepID=A0ABN5W8T7_9SPHN|nr:hypothetical protein [Sphingomonas bisphenolicum]BBF68681.1 hypothetical protein SBA_ch1_08810 [Sphingomonas bisphenolicum]